MSGPFFQIARGDGVVALAVSAVGVALASPFFGGHGLGLAQLGGRLVKGLHGGLMMGLNTGRVK